MVKLLSLRIPIAALLLAQVACVVPVGPEWSDPKLNSPPVLNSASPAVGSVLESGLDAGFPLSVTVALADQNTADTLYARWILDYPPWVDNQSRLALEVDQPGVGSVTRPSISFAPNCVDDQIAHGYSTHRLLLAVSDRPFLDSDATLPDQVQDGNYRVEAAWQFVLDCQ